MNWNIRFSWNLAGKQGMLYKMLGIRCYSLWVALYLLFAHIVYNIKPLGSFFMNVFLGPLDDFGAPPGRLEPLWGTWGCIGASICILMKMIRCFPGKRGLSTARGGEIFISRTHPHIPPTGHVRVCQLIPVRHMPENESMCHRVSCVSGVRMTQDKIKLPKTFGICGIILF